MLKTSQRILQCVSLAVIATATAALSSGKATAQDAILAEVYGHGVHAYYAGNHSQATQFLTAAIDGGLKDPRAYYFRGIVAHSQGRPYEAEADWKSGAELEASMRGVASVGRSLSRFQGSGRLKLEQIRQSARLAALAGQIAPAANTGPAMGLNAAAAPAVTPPVAATPPPAAAAVPPVAAATPPPAPPAAAVADDPFADDGINMAAGDPAIENDDALGDMTGNPFEDDPAAMAGGDPAAAPAAGDPFGGAGGAAPAADDPFAPAGDVGSDPFGGGAASGDAGGGMPAADDPFGGDPFGN